jgi:hypothetical protein
VEQIIDQVLNECLVGHRRKNEVEVHLTREFRNSVMDVRRVLHETPLLPDAFGSVVWREMRSCFLESSDGEWLMSARR